MIHHGAVGTVMPLTKLRHNKTMRLEYSDGP